MAASDSSLKLIDVGLQTLLFTKFGSVMSLDSMNDTVLQYPKVTALRHASERDNKDMVEFISFFRIQSDVDWARQRTPLARRGIHLSYTTDEQTSILTAKAVPVKLVYHVWFWTKSLEIVNDVNELYLFWQHTNPNLNINYLDTYPLEYDLHFGEMIDESTIDVEFEKGIYFVNKVPITIDGWVLSTSTEKTVKTVLLWMYDEDSTPSIAQFVSDLGHVPGGITNESDLQLLEEEYDLED